MNDDEPGYRYSVKAFIDGKTVEAECYFVPGEVIVYYDGREFSADCALERPHNAAKRILRTELRKTAS